MVHGVVGTYGDTLALCFTDGSGVATSFDEADAEHTVFLLARRSAK
jgi:hypothetical protein